MKSSRSGAERDVRAIGVAGDGLRAVPKTRAAMHAFLAVEGRHAAFAGRDRLAAAEFDADFRAAFLTQLREKKNDVIGIT
jgi:hypothetical protein